ncbi:hypothetical protein KI387_033562, partial [Taxus chinensis]
VNLNAPDRHNEANEFPSKNSKKTLFQIETKDATNETFEKDFKDREMSTSMSRFFQE